MLDRGATAERCDGYHDDPSPSSHRDPPSEPVKSGETLRV
jgi:hypothetical protein